MVLQVALAADDNHCRASELVGLPADSITALEFDLACSLKKRQYEAEREKNAMQAAYVSTFIAVNRGMNGGELPDLFED